MQKRFGSYFEPILNRVTMCGHLFYIALQMSKCPRLTEVGCQEYLTTIKEENLSARPFKRNVTQIWTRVHEYID